MTTRLKYLVDINQRSLSEDTDPEYAFEYLDIGAVGRGALVTEPEPTTFAAAPSRARRLVKTGDTIISTVRTYLRAVWPVAEPSEDLVVSTGFAVLSPRSQLDSRYLAWLAQSNVVVEEVVARSVGVSYPAINASEIGDIPVPNPPIEEQRAIADYLDHEMARVNALMATKQRMVELTEERRRSTIEHLLWGNAESSRPSTTLRRVARRIDVGIAEAATHAYEEVGVPLLRSMNIRENAIDSTDLLFIAPWFAERNRSKYVYTNDVLTVRTGAVGVSALVPPEFDRSQCFTQLITTVAPPNSAEFVSLALNSQRAREYFQLTGWGSAQANISVPILASAPIPVVDPAAQLRVADQVSNINRRCERLMNALTSQLVLLAERRDALITAAITGKLSMPGVAA